MKGSPGSRPYLCSDGQLEIDVQNGEQWHALAVCIGRPELAYEGAWDAVKLASPDGPVARVLEEMFSDEPVATWLMRLKAHAVPCNGP